MLWIVVRFAIGSCLVGFSTGKICTGSVTLPPSAENLDLAALRDCSEVDGSISIENTTKLSRFIMPHLRKVVCDTAPCISFRNNSKLKSLWLPKLEQLIYTKVPDNAPLIYLEGDKLELTDTDLENLRYLCGGRLEAVNLQHPFEKGLRFSKPPKLLYSDVVLNLLCVALAVFVVMNFVISIIFLIRRQHMKKVEAAIMNEMLEIRKTSINAKLNRYAVENFQRKNPTKTFTEALAAVHRAPADKKTRTPLQRPSRSLLLEAMAKKTN